MKYMFSPPPLVSRRKLLLWTKSVIREYGIRVKKRFSQSFVVNPVLVKEVLRWLERLGVSSNDFVEEIGTGLGTITYHLASRGYGVLGVEIDWRLALITRELVREYYNCTVVNSDALHTPCYCRVVVSNTPYHISSDLLVSIARNNYVEKAVLILQKEVVDRIRSRPGTRDYGRLTILLNLLFNIVVGGYYSPYSFYPVPEVSSRLTVLVRKNPYSRLHSVLEDVTRALFSERRRKVSKILMKRYGLTSSDIEEMGLDNSVRVYQVCPEKYMEIVEFLVERGFI